MFKRFIKGGGSSKPGTLLGSGATELELTKHFRLLRKLGKGSYAVV